MSSNSVDKEEFIRYVKANMRRAYYSAFAILGSHDDAAEISQMAFIRAYKNFNRFDRSKQFFTWYYKILRNLCLNKIRDEKRKRELVQLEYPEEPEGENLFDSIEQTELKARVEIALNELRDDEREIIILKEFENFSYKEISEMLGIPIGTVMSKLYYVRKKLAKKLEGEI